VCLNTMPPCPSTAERTTSSWSASTSRIPCASASQRRVEPSMSVTGTSPSLMAAPPFGALQSGSEYPKIDQYFQSSMRILDSVW
jgi:hypothetical protein